jgi:hypothetical protein
MTKPWWLPDAVTVPAGSVTERDALFDPPPRSGVMNGRATPVSLRVVWVLIGPVAEEAASERCWRAADCENVPGHYNVRLMIGACGRRSTSRALEVRSTAGPCRCP